ncbi:hypothetical protein OIU77_002749 [Salix suchowensis]|nr:hypothetical protein OIU77_002749 [Salix suchowensis]
MAGFLAKIFVWFLESRIFGALLLYILKKNNLIHKLVSNAVVEESPVFVPLHPFEELNEKEVKHINSDLSPSEQVQQAIGCLPLPSKKIVNGLKPSFCRWTIMDYSKAYTSGEITPYKVAERLVAAIRRLKESTLRYERGEPISCGAIIIGKTNMHELGAGTSGINPHYGATRNPYDPGRITGGSSGGSAAVVAAGLCPVALGVDGGGSVRMPAALCGVVGFKPTFGRVPHSGVLPLNWTVGMVGVLAGTIEDAFLVYAAINGPVPSHETSAIPPPKVYFPILQATNSVPNITLARSREWFNDCSDDIRTCCSQALYKLYEKYGWKTVDVTIPDIEAMRLAHYLTIGSECTAALSSYLENLDIAESGWDVRVALSVYGAFSGEEYIKAQKLRNRQMKVHRNIFTKADVIVTPTVGVTAYPILNDALQTGELDYINGAALVRFQIAGNFLGLPAVTVPVGYDKKGLPIGLQFIGRPWSEPTLIHIAYAMQSLCIPECRKPQAFYDLLKKD